MSNKSNNESPGVDYKIFSVGWWNGGGAIRRNLRTNKSLHKYLSTNPDIFAYGEAGSSTPRGLVLPGYSLLLHPAKIYHQNSRRRGLAIFYRKSLFHKISRAYSSKNFDIFWVRMEKPDTPAYFCFYYAPGSHHSNDTHNEFYADLQIGFDKFYGTGDIFLLGDSNARLGTLLGDKNIHGKHVTGKNKSHFLGFLDYTGLHLLNKIFAFGKPTYEILGRKRSIIDFALASSLEHVLNFQVLPHILGINMQNCHKIIQLDLSFSRKTLLDVNSPAIEKRPSFRHCTYESLLRIRSRVHSKIRDIQHVRSLQGRQMQPSYPAL